MSQEGKPCSGAMGVLQLGWVDEVGGVGVAVGVAVGVGTGWGGVGWGGVGWGGVGWGGAGLGWGGLTSSRGAFDFGPKGDA